MEPFAAQRQHVWMLLHLAFERRWDCRIRYGCGELSSMELTRMEVRKSLIELDLVDAS